MTWLEWAAGSVWQNAWVVLLVALTVGLAARAFSRPATRHALWSVVLLSFLLPLVWPVSPLAESLRIAEQERWRAGERAAFTSDHRARHVADEGQQAVQAERPVEAPVRAATGTDAAASLTRNATQPGQPMAAIDPRSRSDDAAVTGHADQRNAPGMAPGADPRVVAERRARQRRAVLEESRAAQNISSAPANSRPDRAGSRDARRAGDAFVTGTERPRGPQSEPAVALYEPPRPALAGGSNESAHVSRELGTEAPESETTAGSAAFPVEIDTSPLGGQTPAAAGVDPATAGPTISHSPAAVLFFAAVAAALSLRDALSQLPTMPPALWAGGAALLALLSAVRIVGFGRRLRPVGATPAWVQRDADEIAGQLGMRTAPRVVMVRHRMSPLVWCVGEPRIFLPQELWKQLDRAGRRAILCHELAHLRRRDHWVCWLELMVTVLYWWHPVAWWVRHRLHEEADLSCDAWVTWLMPRRRRAYAEALLHTKQFIGPSTAQPVVGAAVTSANAKQLARRLTMVMTHQTRPRHSFVGLGMAGMLVTLAWAAAPAVSCPPDEKDKQKSKSKTDAPTLLAVPVETVTIASTGGAQSTAVTSPAPSALWVAQGQSVSAQDGVATAAPYAVTFPAGGGVSGQGGVAVYGFAPAPGQTTVIAGEPGRMPRFAQSAGGGEPWRGARGRAPVAARADAFGATQEGAQETRLYKLPDGKLKALTELMIREDVPVLVRQAEGGIEVIGTPHQHEIFAAFVALIHPDGRDELPRGGAFGGVRGGGAGGLYSPRPSAVQPLPAVPPMQPMPPGGARNLPFAPTPEAQQELEAARREMEGALKRMPNNARARGMMEREMAKREAAEALRRHADEARAHRDVRVRELQTLSESLRQQAESLREQAERLREQVERLQHEISSGEGDEQTQRTTRRQVRDMERQMRRIEKQVEEAQRRAETSREQAEELEREGDEIDEQVESVEESLQVLNDRLADHVASACADAVRGGADLFTIHPPQTIDFTPHAFDLNASLADTVVLNDLLATGEGDLSQLIARAAALTERVSGEQAEQLAERLSQLAERLAERAAAKSTCESKAHDHDDADHEAEASDEDDHDHDHEQSETQPEAPHAVR